jgi:hypothetical protein
VKVVPQGNGIRAQNARPNAPSRKIFWGVRMADPAPRAGCVSDRIIAQEAVSQEAVFCSVYRALFLTQPTFASCTRRRLSAACPTAAAAAGPSRCT